MFLLGRTTLHKELADAAAVQRGGAQAGAFPSGETWRLLGRRVLTPTRKDRAFRHPPNQTKPSSWKGSAPQGWQGEETNP